MDEGCSILPWGFKTIPYVSLSHVLSQDQYRPKNWAAISHPFFTMTKVEQLKQYKVSWLYLRHSSDEMVQLLNPLVPFCYFLLYCQDLLVGFLQLLERLVYSCLRYKKIPWLGSHHFQIKPQKPHNCFEVNTKRHRTSTQPLSTSHCSPDVKAILSVMSDCAGFICIKFLPWFPSLEFCI